MPRTAQKESADGKGTLEHNPGYTVAQIRPPPEGAQEFPTTDEHGWTRIRECETPDESGCLLDAAPVKQPCNVSPGAFRSVVSVDAKEGNSKTYPPSP